MRFPLAFSTLISLSLTLSAQGFDPVRSATGWARMDKDGSITFFDPATVSLRTWMKDGAEIGAVSLSKLEGAPEKWVIDNYGNAWVCSGGTLYLVNAKSGKVTSKDRLPGDVSDLGWDPKGFVVSYRGSESYIEKREYKSGAVIWSSGSRPRKSAPNAPHVRLAIGDEGQVIIASGGTLPLMLLEGAKGKALGQTAFTFNGAAAPDLNLGDSDRGPIAFMSGKNLVFAAVSGRSVPAARMSGLLLARMDMGQSTVEFLPTGLTEDHLLVGVHESQGIFIKPSGGLVFIEVR